MRRLFLLSVALVLMACPQRSFAGPGQPVSRWADLLSAAFGSTTLPPAWAGIYNATNESRDCVTNNLLDSQAEVDTLCAGQEIGNTGGGLIPVTCTGTTSDTSINVSCSGSGKFFPGCTVTFNYSVVASRSGVNITATIIQHTQYTAGCGIPDECTKNVITGTRVAAPPTPCSTPVDPETWGRTKARYK